MIRLPDWASPQDGVQALAKKQAASTIDKSFGKSVGKSVGNVNIGISDKDRAAIADGLSDLLADTYTLYLTTHNFHWNVTG